MDSQQHFARDERFVRRYEYPDRWVLAVDLAVGDDAVDVDVVGETAIVVVDHGDRVSEAEFDLPGAETRVDVNNGVLTIEVSR